MARAIKTLAISTLFPSSVRPVFGIFVETTLRELLKSEKKESRVIVPIPWFPFRNKRFGEYAQYASTQLEEVRHGIPVSHPRYFLPPAVGMDPDYGFAIFRGFDANGVANYRAPYHRLIGKSD